MAVGSESYDDWLAQSNVMDGPAVINGRLAWAQAHREKKTPAHTQHTHGGEGGRQFSDRTKRTTARQYNHLPLKAWHSGLTGRYSDSPL